MLLIILLFCLVNLLIAGFIFFKLINKGNSSERNEIELQTRLKQLHEQSSLLQNALTQQLMKSFNLLRGQILDVLKQNAEQTDKHVKQLTERTDQRLKDISGQVEKRLSDGFEKTTQTFQDVLKRLTLIDQAQQKITELSTNVVSLQEVLADKRSRGAFGEVQLSGLIANVLPERSYSLQHTFSNGVRADCVLFLPEPTGTICIDAKFPLESYQTMMDHQASESERQSARRQFKKDVQKHIQDIANKYIISGETNDGAVMFIPAESIFAEIHGHYPELVEKAWQSKVWLTSPTTLMAILTTARAVLKDEDTRKQVHIIQAELTKLSEDFGRFQTRMNKLSTHIAQAHKDVEDVNISAGKISKSFKRIEKVEFEQGSDDNLISE